MAAQVRSRANRSCARPRADAATQEVVGKRMQANNEASAAQAAAPASSGGGGLGSFFGM
jgi:hypothetical protein